MFAKESGRVILAHLPRCERLAVCLYSDATRASHLHQTNTMQNPEDNNVKLDGKTRKYWFDFTPFVVIRNLDRLASASRSPYLRPLASLSPRCLNCSGFALIRP